MSQSRLHRLLEVIGLLQAGRGYNANALAQACGVTRRTIFRDLDILREAGVPVVYEESHQRYRIPGACYLPPTNFTTEEALSLILLCHELSSHPGLPLLAPARTAAVKFEGMLPEQLRQQLRSATKVVQIHPAPANPLEDQRPIYVKLLDAAAQRRSVRIYYDSLTEWKEICTKLHPYELLFSRRSWYVIGRSSLHRSTRTFNVGRVLKVEPLEEHFQVPRGFSVNRYFRNAWHLIPERGADHDVVIRFSKMVARNVAEVAWHKTQRVEFNEDGSMQFRVTVSGLNEISWWILGYGDQAEVLKPAKLRRMIAERAARVARKYQGE